MALTIRPARTADRDEILAVVADAFSFGGTRQPNEEIAIVQDTWVAQEGRPLIELVAEENGTLVGHLQAAPGRLDGVATPVAGVAPVCVLTAAHGRGVGSALVRELLSAAEAQRWPLLVLLGDPAYYERFGFGPASAGGLHYAPAGDGNPHFQSRPLAGYDTTFRGEFAYCWE
jgi:putative acetyltransferase